MLVTISLSLNDSYEHNLMVSLPELFKKSIRCQDLAKIKNVSILKHNKDGWIVKYLMGNGNCTYSLVTTDQNEATNVMNELLEMINAIDLIKLIKNSNPIHFDFKLAEQTDYLMKNNPAV